MKKSEKRKRMRRLLLISGSSFLLLVAAGLVDGHITHRWTGSDLLESASGMVAMFPDTIGDWESEELEITREVLTVAGATGSTKRIYRNRATREWIVVTLLCGEHGPISLHPPTVCFTGAGWNAVNQEKAVEYTPTEGLRATMWQAPFEKRENFEEQKIVAEWSWNDGTGWQASSNPRYEFAGAPYLFKLYVISDVELISAASSTRREKFVKALLSELDRTVFQQLSIRNEQDGSVEQ